MGARVNTRRWESQATGQALKERVQGRKSLVRIIGGEARLATG